LRLVASDGDKQSAPVSISLLTVPVEIHLKVNSGLKVLHQSSALITPQNLSFMTNLPDVRLQYTMVDLPEYGVVECSDEIGQYRICSAFMQSDIELSRVRYRHSSVTHPLTDSFSFQIRAGNTTSIVHTFKITFIPVHVKIFNRLTFLLNNTDQLTLTREHLFAWTFPKSFPPQQLVFHIIEPPKFGILSRRIETNRNRRIGVSSNFTQQHIDEQVIFYKLHFIQYSVVNDFFTFRVIAPSVASETIRFDITFIPGLGAIQLINRTVIVDEGGLQKITNESLSLETPDDNNFVFTIGVAPSFGNILLTRPSGAKFTLTIAQNFTTQDINSGSVWYEHLDGENRVDHVYLVAESVYRRSSRIPFWMTIRIILKNDNPPELKGKNEIQIIERGDRILHHWLLPWSDADIDAQPLQFIFKDGFRNAAILSRISPNIHLHNFTQRNILNGDVLMRHLGHVKRFQMQYTVSDGVHEVPSTLTVIASEPFIRFERYHLSLPDSDSILLIPITARNLSALTNLDVNNSQIIFTVVGTHNWIMMDNLTQKLVTSFSQQDISDGKVFYRVSESFDRPERVMVRAGELTSVVDLEKVRQKVDSRPPVEMRTLSVLSVPVASLSQIDSSILFATAANRPPTEIIYDVLQQPTTGTLVLESFKVTGNDRAIMPSNFYVSRFTQAHINAGQLQYLHNGATPSRDSFKFNVSVDSRPTGPFTLFINIIDDQVELTVSNVSVFSGGNTVLSRSIVRGTSSHEDELEFKVTSHPKAGWLALDTWTLANISSLNGFTSSQLNDHRIFYVSNPSTRTTHDSFSLSVCSRTSRCSQPKQVNVLVKQRNVHGPELVRNEVMKIWNSNKAPLTKQYLFSQDDDSPAEQLQYLVSRPINGYLARSQAPHIPIFNFSQAEINRSEVLFVKHKNSTSAGGFSFLVSDGLHQIGPEWFTVESSERVSVAVEANARLVIPPGNTPSTIGMDLLRAHIPNVPSGSVLFSVSKLPKLGNLLLSGRPVQRFSQADINERRLAYKPRSETIDSWSKRDWFHFVVSSNGSTNPVDEEYRFRISITYAAIPASRIDKLIPMRGITITQGGSVAINASYVNLSRVVMLCKEELLVEASRPPHSGLLHFVIASNQSSVVTANQLLSGRALVYRNQMTDDTQPDEIIFHLYPRSESTKRTNRLRIPLSISLNPPTDPLFKVDKIPDQVSVVSGAELDLDPNLFQVSHPHIQPSAIVYRLIQEGSNGVQLTLNGERIKDFSQGDLNKRKVRIQHTQRFDTSDQVDVLVFQVIAILVFITRYLLFITHYLLFITHHFS
uniref:Cadherin domain-containing protein n=1 Tax=Toxocara canis TaxID=6265 RepID=A0A183V3V4_TOXCA